MSFLFTDGRVRVATLDTVHSRRRSAVVVGPLVLPAHDELTARLDAMTAAGPVARVCLQPSATATRWGRVDDAGAPRVYSVAPHTDPAPPVGLLQTVRALDDRGVTVATAGDWLAIDFSHGLGEIPLIHTLLDVLFGITDPHDPASWRRYERTRSPLASAAAVTFGANPVRLAKLLADQRHRTVSTQPGPARAGAGAGSALDPAPSTRVIGLGADEVGELRARRDRHLPGVSMMALFTCALWSSFAQAGLAVGDSVKIPFDVRRYLPAGRGTLASFSAGLDFAIDRTGGPARLHHQMTRAATTGRPVANLLAATMKARGGRRTDRPAGDAAAEPRLHLLHSNLGAAQWNGAWPFRSAERACMLVASDPAAVDGVTVTSVSVDGNLWFTAEFHRSAFDPEAIGAALGLLPRTAAALLAPGGTG